MLVYTVGLGFAGVASWIALKERKKARGGSPRVHVGGLLECGVLRCVAVCCSVAIHSFVYTVRRICHYYSMTSRVHLGVSWSSACCDVLRCVAVCCSVAIPSFVYTVRRIRIYSGTPRVHLGVSWSAACCGVLQCAAVCCSAAMHLFVYTEGRIRTYSETPERT